MSYQAKPYAFTIAEDWEEYVLKGRPSPKIVIVYLTTTTADGPKTHLVHFPF